MTSRSEFASLLPRATVAAFALGFASLSHAAPFTPYMPPLPPGALLPAPGAPAKPALHVGKELSYEIDADSLNAPAPGQVVKWDGLGGVADGLLHPTRGGQIDALSNHGDYLLSPVIRNHTAVVFSTRSGPDVLGAGVDAGMGPHCPFGTPICYETTGGGVGVWAAAAAVDLDHPPGLLAGPHGSDKNLDGLEIFGPDIDADRYSLDDDVLSGVSIYKAGGGVFLTHAALVTGMIGFDSRFDSVRDLIDLDALMVNENSADPAGSGLFDPTRDLILFSLDRFMFGDGTPYFGDETYVWDAVGVSLFDHGGHKWTNGWTGGLNVDALEAAATVVPVPAALPLLGSAIVAVGAMRRRRKS